MKNQLKEELKTLLVGKEFKEDDYNETLLNNMLKDFNVEVNLCDFDFDRVYKAGYEAKEDWDTEYIASMETQFITRGEEEKLENKVKEKYKIDSFIKITGNQIRVIVTGNKHDNVLANNIMRTIQEEYENQMYISIKFE